MNLPFTGSLGYQWELCCWKDIFYYPAISEFITVSKSGRDVHSALGGIARKYGLTYNPNVSLDGVRGAIDPHGLVVGKQENMIPISNG